MHQLSNRSEIDYDDLEEVPRRIRDSRAKGIFLRLAIVVSVLAFAIFMVRGSMPDLTPEQIVQMHGYEGEQAPRRIFNLYSLRKYREATSGIAKTSENAEETTAEVQNNSSMVNGTGKAVTTVFVAKNNSAGQDAGKTAKLAAIASEEPQPVMKKVSQTQERADIVVVEKEATPPVSLKVTTVESEIRLPRQVPVAEKIGEEKIAAGKAENINPAMVQVIATVNAASKSEETESIEVLPILSVKAENTNLRSGPSSEGKVLRNLSKGETITVFDTVGDWTHVGTNDGTSTTGYVHRTLLEAADIEN